MVKWIKMLMIVLTISHFRVIVEAQEGHKDECVDGYLPFSGLDDNSIVEEVRDITQHQGKPAIHNTNYHQVKKFIER